MIALQASVGHGGDNRAADVAAVKQRLRELGFDWVPDTSQVEAETVAAIKLFQAIKGGHQEVAGNPDCDGLVQPGHETVLWLGADNAPRWLLLPNGSPQEGFTSIEREDKNGFHGYGTDWLADTLRAAARSYLGGYASSHAGASLVLLNDASLPHGGPTPEHIGHQAGLSCDLRLHRLPGITPGPTTWRDAEYDRDALRGMLMALRDQPLLTKIFCNDEVLIREGLCSHAEGHDNHAHLEIGAPART